MEPVERVVAIEPADLAAPVARAVVRLRSPDQEGDAGVMQFGSHSAGALGIFLFVGFPEPTRQPEDRPM